MNNDKKKNFDDLENRINNKFNDHLSTVKDDLSSSSVEMQILREKNNDTTQNVLFDKEIELDHKSNTLAYKNHVKRDYNDNLLKAVHIKRDINDISSAVVLREKLFEIMNINSDFSTKCLRMSLLGLDVGKFVDEYLFEDSNLNLQGSIALKACIDTVLNDRNIFIKGSTNKFTQQQRINNLTMAIDIIKPKVLNIDRKNNYKFVDANDIWHYGCYVVIGTPYAGKQILVNKVIELAMSQNKRVHNLQCGERSDVNILEKLELFKNLYNNRPRIVAAIDEILNYLQNNTFYEKSINGDLVELITYLLTMTKKDDVVIINSTNMIVSSIESDGASKGGINKKAVENVFYLLNSIGEKLNIHLVPVFRVTESELDNDIVNMVLGVTWGYMLVRSTDNKVEYVNREESHKISKYNINPTINVEYVTNNGKIFIYKESVIKSLSRLDVFKLVDDDYVEDSNIVSVTNIILGGNNNSATGRF